MSRIGKSPITVPERRRRHHRRPATVTVKGPKGTLEPRRCPAIIIGAPGRRRSCSSSGPTTSARTAALHGLTRSLVNNMVVGVTDGFRKELEIVGVGYRAEAQAPDKLALALGFSHPVIVDAPEGITFEVPAADAHRSSRASTRRVVGQVAANIRSIRKPEPYKGKGVRYAGEQVLRKAGKTGKK